MSKAIFAIGTAPRKVFMIRNGVGQPVDADALPTVDNADEVHVNGVQNGGMGFTISQNLNSTPANITGYYEVVGGPGSLLLNSGDSVSVIIRADVGGVAVNNTAEFLGNPADAGLPSIDIE